MSRDDKVRVIEIKSCDKCPYLSWYGYHGDCEMQNETIQNNNIIHKKCPLKLSALHKPDQECKCKPKIDEEKMEQIISNSVKDCDGWVIGDMINQLVRKKKNWLSHSR